MKTSAQDVKKLREETGISIMMCKNALLKTDGDFKEAKKYLREQGEKIAAKKLIRETHQGIIASYIHNNLKIGAMIEVHCETDFVAKNEEFQNLCKELAIQVAGYNPSYVSSDYIAESDLKKQEMLYRDEFSGRKLTKERIEKAVQSKLEKFKKENSLLSQPYFKDEKKTIEDLIKIAIARLGENIQVKRFVRYQI